MLKICFQTCVIVAVILLAACSPRQPDKPAKSKPIAEQVVADGLVIVVLGDSLTSGFGLAAQQALPEQLQQQFKSEFAGIKVINAGVSGDTSANGLARYTWSVGAVNADLLILALGANDYLLGLDPAITQANLAAILDKAKAENLPVVLAGLTPKGKLDDASRMAQFAGIYPQLAKAYDLPLYPALLQGVRGAPKLLQADGLHPTAEGVRIMAEGLAEFVEPVLMDLLQQH
ncbi:Arylesterase precursor [hydrothermal vent metagenome]|uniref:Arylesterase n=1 Tax=hydrothermal vent metagenome TaxID=652676 RepID=A0A3B0S8D4_9ZZZZ